jgi:type I restriction enzyme M protein
LRNDDFERDDLLGAAYEYLIKMFADSAGKKGGEFYTPGEVVKLLVSLIKPHAGMRVYDPTCGSGGMLIQQGTTWQSTGKTRTTSSCSVRR